MLESEIQVKEEVDTEDCAVEGITSQTRDVVESSKCKVAGSEITLGRVDQEGEVSIRGVVVTIVAGQTVRRDEQSMLSLHEDIQGPIRVDCVVCTNVARHLGRC